MSQPKLGEHYHCYCPCGGCENFEHCYHGECDAPTTFQDLAKVGYIKALKDGHMQWVPPTEFETNPYTFRREVYPGEQRQYMALDSDGSPAPCDKGCDAWSHDDLCPVHGDQVKIWNNKIEAMIDWMEDNDIPLEPWQASAFRAIMRAQGNKS